MRITGDGSPTTGLNLDVQLNDLGLLVRAFPGPTEVQDTIRDAGINCDVNLTMTGLGGTRATMNGSIATSLLRCRPTDLGT